MKVDLRYTPNTVWDTYPWPQAPTSEAVEMVADTAARLIDLRDERLADGLSLEAQYNSLRDALDSTPFASSRTELDAAVEVAYGFSSDEDRLAQLLALNRSIADQERSGLDRTPATRQRRARWDEAHEQPNRAARSVVSRAGAASRRSKNRR